MSLLRRASEGTGFTVADLQKIIRIAPHRYKVFKIKKRSSDQLRTIAQPAKELKHLQRWLVSDELANLPSLRVQVMSPDIRPEANFFLLCASLAFLGLAFFFRGEIKKFAVVQ